MKEIRITFRSEDFAAVSQSMINLGVSFQVEPVEPDEDVAATSSAAAPRRRQAKPKPARGARAGKGEASATSAQPGDREGSGAARLRAMVERNRAATSRPGSDPDDDGAPAGGSGAELS